MALTCVCFEVSVLHIFIYILVLTIAFILIILILDVTLIPMNRMSVRNLVMEITGQAGQ